MYRVAITGVGVVSAIGVGKHAFWNGLMEGTSGARAVTRYDTTGHRVTFAATVPDFDGSKRLGRKLVRRMDRTVQFGVVAAREALKDSGLDLESVDRDRFGVFTGTCNPMDWIWEAHKAFFTKGLRSVSPFTVLCTFPDAAASNIAIDLGLSGMNMTLSSACSSAADALGYAFNLVRSGVLDKAIAGGVEAPVVLSTMVAFGAARALSTRNDDPKRASRPFDKNRDGFVMGEGAGLVTLERYEDAVARGAHIYGELVGYGATCDAHHMTAPREDSAQQVRALRMALKDANLRPDDVDYVNAHGTSTPLNDQVETQSLKALFGKRAYDIPINSTKSMTGHTLGASGGIELVATLLSMENGRIHATVNLEEKDPACDLDYVPEGPREVKIDVAISNSFGFGGKNSILVVKKV